MDVEVGSRRARRARRQAMEDESPCSPANCCVRLILYIAFISTGVAVYFVYLVTKDQDDKFAVIFLGIIMALFGIVICVYEVCEYVPFASIARAVTPAVAGPDRVISPIPGQEQNDNTEPVRQIPAQPSQSSLVASEDVKQPSSQPSATGSLSGDRRGKTKPDQKSSGSEPSPSQKQVQASVSGESSSVSKLLDVASAVSQIAIKEIAHAEGKLETGGTEKASSEEQKVSEGTSPEEKPVGEKVDTKIRQRKITPE